jgi:acyl carrier protein
LDRHFLELRIREVLVNTLSLNLSPHEIPIDRPFSALVGFDSIAVMEYVVGLEKEFGIWIEPDALHLDLLTDIRLLARYIEGRLGPTFKVR